MSFYEKFVKLCADNGVTPNAVTTAIGLSNATATGWKNGKEPTLLNKRKVADYFGVELSYFSNSPLSEALTSLRDCDRALLEVSKTMKEDDVYRIRDFLRGMKDAH